MANVSFIVYKGGENLSDEAKIFNKTSEIPYFLH